MSCQNNNQSKPQIGDRGIFGGACCHHPEPVEVHLHPTSEVIIRVSDVYFNREDKNILQDVNIDIHKGDFWAITGPNGGGKTTLLRLILGLIKPTKGSIEFLGKRHSIGYLPQKNMIDSQFPITVSEVIESGLLGCKGISSLDKKARVLEILKKIELSELSNRPIGRLSGGQLQRVLLGRAIISRPDILVLDEPLSYIDKHFEAHIYRLLAEIASECTILLVSHEMSMIASMANNHLLVDKNVTVCSASHHYMQTECDAF